MSAQIPGELRVILNHALESLEATAALTSTNANLGSAIARSTVSGMFLRAYMEREEMLPRDDLSRSCDQRREGREVTRA